MATVVTYSCTVIGSALPPGQRPMNIVSIVFHIETRDFIEDSNGVRTLTSSHQHPPTAPVVLELQSLAPTDIYQLLHPHVQQHSLCQGLSSTIAIMVNRMGFGLQGFRMDMDVDMMVETVFPVLGPSPLIGASEALLQRLVEEPSLDCAETSEGPNLESEICVICLENLLGSESVLLKMPSCPHVFHRECIVEWLKRKNSCPLCRTVPYE